ncbi:Actin-like protein arp9 (SWI/SNF complex component arp9) [Parahypoxylon ruwenzoriense]
MARQAQVPSKPRRGSTSFAPQRRSSLATSWGPAAVQADESPAQPQPQPQPQGQPEVPPPKSPGIEPKQGQTEQERDGGRGGGSTWKRVGPRELGSIGGPWLNDSSSHEDNDSSSESDSDQDDNSQHHNQDSTGGRSVNPFSTPTRRTKYKTRTKKKNETPRSQRAIRRELARRQSAATNNNSPTPGRTTIDMASQQGKWREDQILVICPGSQTTMAQLGCSELTPPAHRIPTRMFKDEETNEYTPYHTYKRKKAGASGGVNGGVNGDNAEDQWEFIEDRDSVERAIYPLQGGRIVNMEAFLAFLDHVHSLLTTTYHNTPIMLMASPQWTRPDCESIARYIFEKTKTPALCLLHSAIAAQYGLKWPTMTVVDIGFEKVDVTCIHDHIIVGHKDLGYPNPAREISGGEMFTRKLLSLLEDKKFTYDMAEQLKKTPLCEVLPYVPDVPDLMELPTDELPLTASQAPGTTLSTTEGPRAADPPKPAAALGGETENGIAEEKGGEEGVFDVANIVTSGNTREFLAKREKEKAEKEKTKSKKQGKGQEAEAAAAKPVRLPNAKRKVNSFHYEELVHEDVEVPISNGAPRPEPTATVNGDEPVGDAPPAVGVPSGQEAKPDAKPEGNAEATGDAAEPTTNAALTERRTKRVRRDIEIGLERFLFADRAEINRITDTIYRAIQGIDDTYKRAGCWDNIVFVGNGSRLRGLRENIMQTLIARHLISPSTATIFTSELPSNMATPSGTGSQTPTGSFNGQVPISSSVDPLLRAATTAATLGVPGTVQAPGSTSGEAGSSHHSHGQTPMSIKQANIPTYLAEWTKNGFEEAMFLGSLVASRLAYCIHNLDVQTTESQRMMSLNRVDYNEHGPKLIHSHSMLGGS